MMNNSHNMTYNIDKNHNLHLVFSNLNILFFLQISIQSALMFLKKLDHFCVECIIFPICINNISLCMGRPEDLGLRKGRPSITLLWPCPRGKKNIPIQLLGTLLMHFPLFSFLLLFSFGGRKQVRLDLWINHITVSYLSYVNTLI